MPECGIWLGPSGLQGGLPPLGALDSGLMVSSSDHTVSKVAELGCLAAQSGDVATQPRLLGLEALALPPRNTVAVSRLLKQTSRFCLFQQ